MSLEITFMTHDIICIADKPMCILILAQMGVRMQSSSFSSHSIWWTLLILWHWHARLQTHSALQGPAHSNINFCRYFHGGGWVLGGNVSHRAVAATLASECKATVVAVDYALAPEHPFPAGVEDSWAAVQWAAQNAGTLELLAYDLYLLFAPPPCPPLPKIFEHLCWASNLVLSVAHCQLHAVVVHSYVTMHWAAECWAMLVSLHCRHTSIYYILYCI